MCADELFHADDLGRGNIDNRSVCLLSAQQENISFSVYGLTSLPCEGARFLRRPQTPAKTVPVGACPTDFSVSRMIQYSAVVSPSSG